MRLLFNEIEVHNFMSFENAEMLFDNKGFVHVSGINECTEDSAGSNGSGKSAIFDALSWVICGETTRGTKDIIRINSDGGAYVRLSFKKDNDLYEIIRSKAHKVYKTNLFINKNGTDISGKGIRDTEKILSEELPDLTPALLNSVILLGQGLPGRLSNNTPSGRKLLLEQLTNSEFMIDDVKSRVESRYSVMFAKNTKLTNEINVNAAKIDLIKSMNSKLEDDLYSLGSIDNIKELKEKAVSERKVYEEQLNGITVISEESILEKKAALNNLTLAFNENKCSTVETYSKKLSAVTIDIASVDAQISKLKEELKAIESNSEFCPTCGQRLPSYSFVDTTPIKDNITDLSKYASLLVEKKTGIEQEMQNTLDSSLREYKFSCSEMQKSISSDEEFNRNQKALILSIKNNITSLDNKISECTLKIETYNSIKAEKEATIKENMDTIHSIEAKVEEYKKYLVDTATSISILQKMQTLIKRDFRGVLLSNIINYIDNKAKEYCFDIFHTHNIKFYLDGNDLNITYNNKFYEMLSGGEKQKIDVIIQFAIRDMLCNFSSFSSNILILDEITDNLDLTGCNNLITFINNRLQGVSSVFIISHRAEFQIPCDSKIVVYKNNDAISTITQGGF